MEGIIWSELNKHQLGLCAEYLAMVELIAHGLKVDRRSGQNRQEDLIATNPKTKESFKIQVNALLKGNYTFIYKEKMTLEPDQFVILLLFSEDGMPSAYAIPATAWQTPNKTLVTYDYDKPGQERKPEYGISLHQDIPIDLEKYLIDKSLPEILGGN